MELSAYLERIGYGGTVAPTAAVLRELHRRHLLTVPFENLDIPLGCEIRLDVERIYDKLVRRRRGGFCYEHNGLCAWALKEIGFDVTMLSAGVARPDGSYGPEFDHMLLLVSADGERWLADVGFGDSFREPLRLDERGAQRDAGMEYQVSPEAGRYALLRREGERWAPKYRFTLEPRHFREFGEMCRFQQTSPESSFTRRLVCSIATPDGRITLTDKSLIVTANGERTETLIHSAKEFEQRLREHFGMELTGFRVPVAG